MAALLVLAALAVFWLAWRALRPRRRHTEHRFLIDWDYRGLRPGYQVAGLRAQCAHPSCTFDVTVWDDEEDKARRAYARFHRSGAQ